MVKTLTTNDFFLSVMTILPFINDKTQNLYYSSTRSLSRMIKNKNKNAKQDILVDL